MSELEKKNKSCKILRFDYPCSTTTDTFSIRYIKERCTEEGKGVRGNGEEKEKKRGLGEELLRNVDEKGLEKN